MELGLRINSSKELSSIVMEIDTKEILVILAGTVTDFTNIPTNQSTKECGKTTKKMVKVIP